MQQRRQLLRNSRLFLRCVVPGVTPPSIKKSLSGLLKVTILYWLKFHSLIKSQRYRLPFIYFLFLRGANVQNGWRWVCAALFICVITIQIPIATTLFLLSTIRSLLYFAKKPKVDHAHDERAAADQKLLIALSFQSWHVWTFGTTFGRLLQFVHRFW